MNEALPLAQLQHLRTQLSHLDHARPADQDELRRGVQFFIDEVFSLPYGRFLYLDGPVLRQRFAYLDNLHQQLEQGQLQLSRETDWHLVLSQMLLVIDAVIEAEATQ